MSNFVDCEREQAFLLPSDFRDWIPEDDLAHFVIEAVERVAIGAFKMNDPSTGSSASNSAASARTRSSMAP